MISYAFTILSVFSLGFIIGIFLTAGDCRDLEKRLRYYEDLVNLRDLQIHRLRKRIKKLEGNDWWKKGNPPPY
jgi:hypothetical protein